MLTRFNLRRCGGYHLVRAEWHVGAYVVESHIGIARRIHAHSSVVICEFVYVVEGEGQLERESNYWASATRDLTRAACHDRDSDVVPNHHPVF